MAGGEVTCERADVTFVSGGVRCAGWLYRPTQTGDNIPCVVMAHGFGLTRRDTLSLYAEALTRTGAAVLVYDHRFLGDSEGLPRQRIRMPEQLTDRLAAVAFARTIDGVDPRKIVVWGFSFSGGSAVQAAAADERLAGAILLCPFLDGRWRSNRGLRTQPGNALWVIGRALRDALVPVADEPAGRAAMCFPGELDGFRSVVMPGWRNEVHARVALPLAWWRPVTLARKITCPILVQAGHRDVTVSALAIDQLGQRAPRAVLKWYDCDHFEPFHGEQTAQIIADQVAWLRSTLTR